MHTVSALLRESLKEVSAAQTPAGFEGVGSSLQQAIGTFSLTTPLFIIGLFHLDDAVLSKSS